MHRGKFHLGHANNYFPYYYEYEENSYVEKDWFATDVWEKYPVYKYDVG